VRLTTTPSRRRHPSYMLGYAPPFARLQFPDVAAGGYFSSSATPIRQVHRCNVFGRQAHKANAPPAHYFQQPQYLWLLPTLIGIPPAPYLRCFPFSYVRPHATTLMPQSFACHSWAFAGDSTGVSSIGRVSCCGSSRPAIRSVMAAYRTGPRTAYAHKTMNLFDGKCR
jgi:hypothetical protein